MLNTLEYFWPDISAKRAERLLLETELPGSYLLRSADSGDTLVSFLDKNFKVKHYFVNQRGDSALYKAHPELKNSLEDTFMFMRETSLEWLYPVNRDDASQEPPICEASVNETSDDGDSCRVCGLLNPNSYHMNYHRVFYCKSCNKMIERPGWTVHKCNQRQHFCQDCDYVTLVPSNLRRHVEAKHPTNNNITNNNSPHEGDGGEADAGEADAGEADAVEADAVEADAVEAEEVVEEENLDAPPSSRASSRPSQEGTSSKKRVTLMWISSAVMTAMMIVITCITGTAGLLSMCNQTETKDFEENWEWLEKPKRGRGRPRCPPGWLTCGTCGYLAPSKQRLRVHERKHDREMKKANQKWECKHAQHGCKYTTKRKSDLTKHQKTCRKKPVVPKTLGPETLWDIISLFPLSNNLAYKFLKMLESALEFRFLPTGLREDMKTRLNCCMQFLEAEIVQFKVKWSII